MFFSQYQRGVQRQLGDLLKFQHLDFDQETLGQLYIEFPKKERTVSMGINGHKQQFGNDSGESLMSTWGFQEEL